ncbi:hypothetical protein E2C01_013013 [Portunus trituberculatus]|uniref:Uncharacterized protein n=1 Tax=Portunus trituberculatus TaxID=210409 RepID=A0A5B7DF73_PORTR|nr:hypothetical protein [Portunus trituberculatus]
MNILITLKDSAWKTNGRGDSGSFNARSNINSVMTNSVSTITKPTISTNSKGKYSSGSSADL